MARINSEEELSFQVAMYLTVQYPSVLYHFDYGSGVRLTMGQAAKQKRLNKRSWPDLFIAKDYWLGAAIHHHGLFIELKKEGTKLYLKDGRTMVSNTHYKQQAETLQKLRDSGYKAEFAIGFEHAKRVIDFYLRMI